MPSSLLLRLRLLIQRSLDRRSLQQPLMPLPRLGVLLLHLLRKRLPHPSNGQVVPSDEHQVGEAHLVAYEIRLASFVEMVLDDAPDALDFVQVAVDD